MRFERATYKPYISMLVQWQANIICDGATLRGTAERRSESSFAHPPFKYDHNKRQQGVIVGRLRYALYPKLGWVVDIHITHKAFGAARETTASHTLGKVASHQMNGVFSSDASDSSGRVSWAREVHRLPDLTWFVER